MPCNLDKFTTYSLGSVVHDSADDSILVKIVNAPASCPDQSFTTHKGKIAVQKGVGPILTYDRAHNMPMIIVPRKEMIEEVEHPTSWGSILVMAFVAAILCYVGWQIICYLTGEVGSEDDDGGGSGKKAPMEDKAREAYAKQTGTTSNSGYAASNVKPPVSDRASTPRAPQPTPPAPSQTTVINNGGGNNGLVTGLILGEMLGHSHDREVIRERETVRDVPVKSAPAESSSFASDDNDTPSSSFESDSNDNEVSSDSGSSYSSDDSSSYSSDDSSSFSSSDDSSSFSSDSGSFDSGSSFSGD